MLFNTDNVRSALKTQEYDVVEIKLPIKHNNEMQFEDSNGYVFELSRNAFTYINFRVKNMTDEKRFAYGALGKQHDNFYDLFKREFQTGFQREHAIKFSGSMIAKCVNDAFEIVIKHFTDKAKKAKTRKGTDEEIETAIRERESTIYATSNADCITSFLRKKFVKIENEDVLGIIDQFGFSKRVLSWNITGEFVNVVLSARDGDDVVFIRVSNGHNGRDSLSYKTFIKFGLYEYIVSLDVLNKLAAKTRVGNKYTLIQRRGRHLKPVTDTIDSFIVFLDIIKDVQLETLYAASYIEFFRIATKIYDAIPEKTRMDNQLYILLSKRCSPNTTVSELFKRLMNLEKGYSSAIERFIQPALDELFSSI